MPAGAYTQVIADVAHQNAAQRGQGATHGPLRTGESTSSPGGPRYLQVFVVSFHLAAN